MTRRRSGGGHRTTAGSSPGTRRPAARRDSFAAAVFDALSHVPAGRVVTYGDLARMAGRPRAARAVGRLMATATAPGLPYHRVVAAGGWLGGYGSGTAFKAARLAAEGVVIRRTRIANFDARRWGG